MATFKTKKKSYGLEVKTFPGGKGNYLVIVAGKSEYHVFVEVEAKEAATDCGCKLDPSKSTTRQMWKELWNATP
jgi:hypothetical protein